VTPFIVMMGDFARYDGRPTPRGVGSAPPFEKGGRKLFTEKFFYLF
jgi:hypothetical protein